MRIRALIPMLAIALIGTAAYAKPPKAKHKKPDAAAADQAGEQGEEPVAPGGDKEPDLPELPGLVWQRGPVKADLGNATIDIPAGFAFTNTAGTRLLMEAMHNEPNDSDKGTIWKIAGEDSWFVVFDYDDSGHVKDDDKDELKGDELLKTITENNEAGNEDRRSKGWTPLHVIGWAVPPHYDEQTHNLEWGTKVQSEAHQDRYSVNYEVRLLGRTGVMSAVLVVKPQLLETAVPEFKSALGKFVYSEGSRYGDYKQGDKLAEYGIAALVAGGAVAVAAKSGLLAKLIKPIVAGIAAIGAGISRLFKRGSKQAAATPDIAKKA